MLKSEGLTMLDWLEATVYSIYWYLL
jgi:hypothetical protein